MAQNVTIKGKTYVYRYDLGAMLRYEHLTGELSEKKATGTMLSTVMHYSCLAGDESFPMSLASFVNSIEDKETLEALNKAFEAEQERWESANTGVGESSEKKGAAKKK